ncbi:MAG TPA: hypothetical protein VF552_03225 [Allosphingosinicella sp.]
MGAIALAGQAAGASPPAAGPLSGSEKAAAMRVVAGHYPPATRLFWHWPAERTQAGFCGWVSPGRAANFRQFFIVGERRRRGFSVDEAGVADSENAMVGDICASWGYPRTMNGAR